MRELPIPSTTQGSGTDSVGLPSDRVAPTRWTFGWRARNAALVPMRPGNRGSIPAATVAVVRAACPKGVWTKGPG
jgi:hypothetical protein